MKLCLVILELCVGFFQVNQPGNGLGLFYSFQGRHGPMIIRGQDHQNFSETYDVHQLCAVMCILHEQLFIYAFRLTVCLFFICMFYVNYWSVCVMVIFCVFSVVVVSWVISISAWKIHLYIHI